jgi:tRNA G18 (ribose-2'-O)-methylase SpoU
MNLIEIKDINSDEILIYKMLRDKQFSKDNLFIADSPKVINILLDSNIEFVSIFATIDYYKDHEKLISHKNIPNLYVASKDIMENIVGHKIHHNAMACGIRPKPHFLENLGDKIVMLDNITSTENIGSIARSLAGLKVDSYLLSNHSPHPYSRRSLRVSMGYISHLKYSIYVDIIQTIPKLKKLGYKIYGAEITSTSTPLSKVNVSDKWVLIMGHEGHGLSNEVITLCDEIVTIEMSEDVKSFNVAIASSIIMYKFMN